REEAEAYGLTARHALHEGGLGDVVTAPARAPRGGRRSSRPTSFRVFLSSNGASAMNGSGDATYRRNALPTFHRIHGQHILACSIDSPMTGGTVDFPSGGRLGRFISAVTSDRPSRLDTNAYDPSA